ncbi:MAG: basic amino acid ABC transporter substrate-binding protein [Candidatus Poribacteria bacterium]|nr:MAG: basic amino acid ABC transporter substrate-binding protein [Candidatus Poribacteria bacterium]
MRRIGPVWVLLLALGLLACSRVEERTDRIVVVTDATYQPFEFFDENRQIVGFDIDLMREIGKRAGFEVEFVHQPFVGGLAGIESGQYDAMISAMTITEDRKKTFLFSDPYYDAGQIIAVREDQRGITGLEDLRGRKIGVQRGTTGALLAQTVPGAAVLEYDTIDLAFLALRNGTVDAVINDEPTSRTIARTKGGFRLVGVPLTNEQYGIAFRKDRADLAERVNRALAELKADGTLRRLHQKWIVEYAGAEASGAPSE